MRISTASWHYKLLATVYFDDPNIHPAHVRNRFGKPLQYLYAVVSAAVWVTLLWAMLALLAIGVPLLLVTLLVQLLGPATTTATVSAAVGVVMLYRFIIYLIETSKPIHFYEDKP